MTLVKFLLLLTGSAAFLMAVVAPFAAFAPYRSRRWRIGSGIITALITVMVASLAVLLVLAWRGVLNGNI